MRDLFLKQADKKAPRLVIDRKLGEGKYEVFHAFQPESPLEYAIKVFPHEAAQLNFIKEKRIHSKLNHPNIIRFQPQIKLENDQKFDFLLIEYAPFGTLFDLALEKLLSSEILIRSLFHQLINGLEYIHSQNVAHLDLKLENLLIGDDYQLKIADFDQAQYSTEGKLMGRGSQHYRAPEVIELRCKDLKAADMFSIGIILFGMKAGELPFEEQDGILIDYDLFLYSNEEFWNKKLGTRQNKDFFSQEFKQLVNGLLRYNPERRLKICQVKESKWYKGEILENSEYNNVMESKWEKIMFLKSTRKSQDYQL